MSGRRVGVGGVGARARGAEVSRGTRPGGGGGDRGGGGGGDEEIVRNVPVGWGGTERVGT